MKLHKLLPQQLGVFLEWVLNPDKTQYNLALTGELPPGTDLDRLAAAIERLPEFHPEMRTRFVAGPDGMPMQYIDPQLPIAVKRTRLAQSQVEAYNEHWEQPYTPYAAEALWRFEIVETEAAAYLYAGSHHTVSDGSTHERMCHDIGMLYRGETPQASTDLMQWIDDNTIGDTDLEPHRQWWSDFMGDAELSTITSEVDNRWGKLGIVSEKVPVEGIDQWCANHEVRPSALFMAAFAHTMGAITRQSSVAFNTGLHGRVTEEAHRFYGMFVQNVPFAVHEKPGMTVLDSITAIRPALHGVMQHTAYSFTDYAHDTGQSMGTVFSFQKGLAYTIELGCGSVSLHHVVRPSVSNDLEVLAYPHGNSYVLTAKYSTALDCERQAATFLTAMGQVIAQMVARPHDLLSGIALTSPQEQAELLAQAKGETLAYDTSETFITMLDRVSAAQGADRAVVGSEGSLTYAELCAQSNALAAELQQRGVRTGDHVALMLPRQASTIMAMVAIQRLGAAYVPLDAEYPQQRLAYMLADSDAAMLVTTHALWRDSALAAGDLATPVLFLDDLALQPRPDAGSINLAKPELPAYMIYTSGSTGQPKGVEVPHRGMHAYIEWNTHLLYHQGGQYAAHPSFSFDASINDIFCPLACGGTCHLMDEELRKDITAMSQYVASNKIEGITLSTALGLAFITQYPDTPTKWVVMGGEKMLPFPKNNIDIYNAYGPTEFSVGSSIHKVDQERDFEHDIPIGRPVPNTWSMICDPGGNLLPRGMAGELCLAGPQLSLGYYKNPEKTAKAFVECRQLAGEGFGTMYRTGDLARYNDNNEIEYMGRIDFQVKLRGFRIELGEIEHVAKGFAGVGAVIADVRPVGNTKLLCLYYTATAPVDKDALKAHLASNLTYYMVPDSLNELETMPMTPNGKINRRALPQPTAEQEEIVEPANKMERMLLAEMKELLKTDGFGVTSNLISCGMSSLMAIKFAASLQQDWGLAIKATEMLAHPTIREIAELLSAPGAQQGEKAVAHAAQQTYPLTENQRGIYIDWELNRDALQYNVPVLLRAARGASEVTAAIGEFAAAHPYLKATLTRQDGEVRVKRNDDMQLDIACHKVGTLPDAGDIARTMRPFDLFAEPLCRFTVYEAQGECLIFADIHHIIFDGASVSVLLSQLGQALQGTPIAPETYTAYDHALDVEQAMQSEQFGKALSYFDTLLGDFEVASLPHSTSGVTAQPQAGVASAKVAASAVDDFCRKQAVTPNSFFMAAATQTLHRITREPSLLITSITSGRDSEAMQGITGMFVQTLPVVTAAAKAGDTVASVVSAMQQQYIATQANALVPYTTITQRYKAKAEVMFAYEGGLIARDQEQVVELVPLVNTLDTAKMPIDITVSDGDECYSIRIEYDTSLYNARDMQALAGSIAAMAQGMASAVASSPINGIGLVTQDELPAVIAASKGKELDYDTSQTFIDLFLRQAAERPDATAVVDADGTMTYGELDRRSNVLARELVAAGVAKNQFVGTMVPRRAWWPVSIIGIQKAGAAYMPLDVDYPIERLEYMIGNSQATVLVTTRELYEQKCAQGDIKVGKVIFLDELDYAAGAEPINLATPQDMAYIIYTSGSTGLPKGAMLHHRGLLNYIYCKGVYGLQPGDRVGAHYSFSFDAHTGDIYPTLVAGAEMHIMPSEIRQDTQLIHRYILEHKLHCIGFTTSVTMLMLNAYPDMPLRHIATGGEKLSNVYSDHIRIFNEYGPTECNNDSTYHIIEPGTREDNIPIGRPMPNLYGFVTDTAGQLLPLGMAGELCVAGRQVGYGYWELPEKTAECFGPCPWAEGERMYRTGDLVRYNSDGELEYLGRIDSQVKFHGFRIELGEIERHAMASPVVEEAIAKVADIKGVKHLVLYVTASDGATIDTNELKRYLEGTSLARYMLPEVVVVLESMPRLPNGKIARKLMPEPEISLGGEYVEPANDTERSICEAFAQVLALDKVGATDDFFAIGGSSLGVMHLIVELAKRDITVVYANVFDNSSPRKLAAHLSGSASGGTAAPADTQVTDYDYTAIDQLLQGNTLDAFRQGERQPLGTVLLTGATGFLGIHLLNELLGHDGVKRVVCLVRGKAGLAPEAQLRSLLFYYFERTFDDAFASGRITVSGGDVTHAESIGALQGMGIDTVINCAAVVKHFSSDSIIEDVNVGGTRNLIDFCCTTGARLVQVSTSSVAGLSVNGTPPAGTLLTERQLYVGQDLSNKYVHSKFIAEREVLQAMATRGLSAKIMRVGNLSARDDDGEFQINFNTNSFMGRLRVLRMLGMCTYEMLDQPVEFSPIDETARAIALLATTPRACCVFHPYNAHSALLYDVINQMNAMGLTVSAVEAGEFAQALDQAAKNPKKAELLTSMLAYQNMDKTTTFLDTDNGYTLGVLHRLGYSWPATSGSYAHRFLDAISALGYFDIDG